MNSFVKTYFSCTLAVVGLCIIATSNIYACWCSRDSEETRTDELFRQTIARETESSDFVFAGRMIEEKDRKIVFETDDVWKGDFRGHITFSYDYNSDFVDTCEFRFEANKSYLVYAVATLEGLRVTACGRSGLTTTTQRDIDELNRKKSLLSFLVPYENKP